ncbi:MAG: Fis family transcriptional regulator [Nitrospinae bacterium CG11_big_fil_rev_8_21_14_0_20_56_8]|nr:MAG: Fis family transcriptional regulator [Nitrospinae bacterium CG11_big_fil_rev_8_21_14_0_20_56_8]
MKKKKKPALGSSLDDLLDQDGTLGEATAIAMKRVIAHQLERSMKERNLSKTQMSKIMHTSRSALDRLLDEQNTSVTLQTISNAAKAVGKRLRVELVDG